VTVPAAEHGLAALAGTSLAGPSAETPLLSVEVRHLGGALGRVADPEAAQAKVHAQYLMFAAGHTPTAERGNEVRAHLNALEEALTPWPAGYDYYNLLETPAEAQAALPPEAHRRCGRSSPTTTPTR
jgi:hypothetical protein